jgi:RNA polymerase sigma-70 factor (ECF subfamily)
MILNFEKDSFQKIYGKLKKPIHRYVSRSVRDGEVAEELTQDVFLKAFRARHTFECQRSFSTWLWTIARNTVCDWHRKHGADLRVPSGPEGESPCDELPSRDPDVETLICEHGERQALLRRLAGLTALQRKVLQMRIIHELSYQEIAKNLGLSISAAKCLFYRARLALTQVSEPVFA